MPASSPGLVVGRGSSGTMSIAGASLGCIVADLSDNGSRNIQDYQTLCDDASGYQQGTPGALTREVSTTVEFIVGGAGIAAADAALESGDLVTINRSFAGQTTGTDDAVYSGFVTSVRKSVAPGAATGQVQVTTRVVADGAVTP